MRIWRTHGYVHSLATYQLRTIPSLLALEVELIKPWMPMWLQRLILGLFVRITIGKYSNYGLQEPDHAIFECGYTCFRLKTESSNSKC